MTIPTVKDRREILQQGADIVAPTLVPHGFHFSMVSSGSSSGGAFSHGEFVRGDRKLELHFRWSLGLVTYHIGTQKLGHEDYMRALLGRSQAGHYPLCSDDPLAGFEALRQDLVEHCSDFISGTGEQFRQCIEKHRHYESLSPLQKMEFGVAQPVAGANRRWRLQFRCRGSRRESAVAQLFSLGRDGMRTLKFITFLFILAFGSTASAQLHWKEHRSVDEEFKSSDIVIVGKVIGTKDVLDSDRFIQGTFYSIRVTEVIKGGPLKTVELYSENSSGRFPMEVGTSYLIFAYQTTFEGIQGPHLAIDNCGNSGTVKQSKKTLKIVRKLARPNQSPEPTATRPGVLDDSDFMMFPATSRAGCRWPWLSFFR